MPIQPPRQRLRAGLALLLLSASLAACLATKNTEPGSSRLATSSAPADSVEAQIEREILVLVNRYRSALGASLLEENSTLASLAREHSSDMASGASPIGHYGLDLRANYAATALGVTEMAENVGTTFKFPRYMVARTVVSNWIRSPGHRRNLEGNYSITGVGVSRSADGTYYVTEEYARR